MSMLVLRCEEDIDLHHHQHEEERRGVEEIERPDMKTSFPVSP